MNSYKVVFRDNFGEHTRYIDPDVIPEDTHDAEQYAIDEVMAWNTGAFAARVTESDHEPTDPPY